MLIMISFRFLNIGEATILQKFDINEKNKKVSVAGCRCVKGVLLKSGLYRIVRGNENIFTGKFVMKIMKFIY